MLGKLKKNHKLSKFFIDLKDYIANSNYTKK